MSYRYAKEKKKKKIAFFLGAVFLLLLMFTSSFQALFGFLEGSLSRSWENKESFVNGNYNFFQTWYGKSRLVSENRDLEIKNQNLEIELMRTRYLSDQLDQMMGVSDQGLQPAHILSRRADGDVFVNQGQTHGVQVGDAVYSSGFILIGFVDQVFDVTSRVGLLTHPESTHSVVLFPQKETVTIQGNGNEFRIDMPRDIQVAEGDLLYDQADLGAIVGVVRSVEFDPRDPFQTVYASYPISLSQIDVVGIGSYSAALIDLSETPTE